MEAFTHNDEQKKKVALQPCESGMTVAVVLQKSSGSRRSSSGICINLSEASFSSLSVASPTIDLLPHSYHKVD